jgi:hypothetical protein
MSLGRSSHFKDSDFEIDLLQRPDPESPLKSYQFYVNLAIIQSGIVSDLQGSPARRDERRTEAALRALLLKMDGIWVAIKAVGPRLIIDVEI